MQDAIAADALVHHAEGTPALARDEAAGELIGPAMIGVELRYVAVGERIAERDDAAGCGGRLHLDGADDEERVRGRLHRHYGGSGEVARRRDVAGLMRIAVAGDRKILRHRAGEM